MALSAVALLQPRMLFVTSDKEDPSSSASSSRTPGLGVGGYYQVSTRFPGEQFWRQNSNNFTTILRISRVSIPRISF